MNGYKFVDGLIYAGDPYMKKGMPLQETLAMMDRAGIDSAVICTEEQLYCAPDSAVEAINKILAFSGRFYGLYPMLTEETGELPPFEKVMDLPEYSRYAGLLLEPEAYHIPLKPIYLAKSFTAAEKYSIPVWYHAASDRACEYISEILEKFPKLTMVLSFEDEWPNNRKVYPIISNYANTYLAVCNMIWMGAYEDFTGYFGAERLIFATRSPVKYPGAAMFDLRKAGISDEDKQKIASGNLLRLIGGIKRG